MANSNLPSKVWVLVTGAIPLGTFLPSAPDLGVDSSSAHLPPLNNLSPHLCCFCLSTVSVPSDKFSLVEYLVCHIVSLCSCILIIRLFLVAFRTKATVSICTCLCTQGIASSASRVYTIPCSSLPDLSREAFALGTHPGADSPLMTRAETGVVSGF